MPLSQDAAEAGIAQIGMTCQNQQHRTQHTRSEGVSAMKHLLHPILFAVSLSLGIAPLTSVAAETATPGPQIVSGDLLKIEGEFYTVHDTAGHETKLHVDKTTKLDGTFKTGDRVEAQMTDKNHTLSMKHANPAK